MPGGLFETWLVREQEIALGLQPVPAVNSHRLILCANSLWGGGATVADIEATELSGYSRPVITLPSQAEWDLIKKEGRLGTTVDIIHNGGNLVFDGIAWGIESGGNLEHLIAGYRYPTPQTIYEDIPFKFKLNLINSFCGETW